MTSVISKGLQSYQNKFYLFLKIRNVKLTSPEFYFDINNIKSILF